MRATGTGRTAAATGEARVATAGRSPDAQQETWLVLGPPLCRPMAPFLLPSAMSNGFAERSFSKVLPYWAARAAAPSSCAARNFSASSAAMQPSPAAVTAWRKILSLTSPAANTPGTTVAVESGTVRT